MRAGLVAILACALLLAACAPGGAEALPTLTLIPPSETPPPSDIPPSATPDPLIVVPEEVTLTPDSTAGNETPTPVSLIEADPVAAELVALATRILAQDLGLPQRRIQLVEVETVRWRDTSLGCPQPDQTYSQIEIPGYRIVLEAGDTTYAFHTDFDRVLPCPEGSEVLPTPADSDGS